MNEHDIFDAVGSIGDDLIDRANARAVKLRRRRRILVPLLAACLTLLIAISLSVIGHFAIESAVYDRAVLFFAENGLSADGLTRDEVKSVYKDISRGEFIERRTAELLSALALDRYSTELVSHDSHVLKSFWELHEDDIYRLSLEAPKGNTVMYYQDRDMGHRSALACHVDGEELWFYKLQYYEWRFIQIGDEAIIHGYYDPDGYARLRRGFIMRFDKENQLVWQYNSDLAEDISTVAYNCDGELTSFGIRHEYIDDETCIPIKNELTMTVIGLESEEITRHTVALPEHIELSYLRRALKTSNGYLVQFSDSEIMHISDDGVFLGVQTYHDIVDEYKITDMLWHGGRTWISVTKQEEYDEKYAEFLLQYESFFEKWPEPSDDTAYLSEKAKLDRAFGALTETALLICDGNGELIESFIEKAAVVAHKLEVNSSGSVFWTVLRFDEVVDIDYRKAFLFWNGSYFKLIFNADGTPLGRVCSGYEERYY